MKFWPDHINHLPIIQIKPELFPNFTQRNIRIFLYPKSIFSIYLSVIATTSYLCSSHHWFCYNHTYFSFPFDVLLTLFSFLVCHFGTGYLYHQECSLAIQMKKIVFCSLPSWWCLTLHFLKKNLIYLSTGGKLLYNFE